ncbi:lysosomal membrane ascorbate-dependent ferrireductase CYB561A3-like isoform X2 [Danio rerio]
MVTSLVVLYGNAIVLYRVPLTWSRWRCKLSHAGLLSVAVVLSVLGVCAAFDFHRGNNIPHLYSLHSWIGISTVVLFTLQWFGGLCAFLLPWTPLAFRVFLKPLHVWMGTAIFILSLIASLSGISEKLLLTLNGRNGSNTEPYTALPAEALFANSLGILVVIFGLVVLRILSNHKWKNPQFENESDRERHPGVVFCCCCPSASRLDLLCLQGCSSAYLGCNEWLFELLLTFYQLESVWPFSSDL